MRNNLEHTSSPVRATHPDGSRRHRRVSGPEFQFRQIKACRFRTFSRLAERSWECIRLHGIFHTYQKCRCAIVPSAGCRFGYLYEKKKTTQKHRRYAGCNLEHSHKSSQSECLLSLPFFWYTPRAVKSSKSTRGADKLGQLLHRLVSKLRYASVCGFGRLIE